MNKLFNIVPWYVWVLIALASVSAGALGLYQWGYNKAESKYEIILAEQKQKIETLEAREEVVRVETVTVYKDRVRTVTKVQEKIVEVTRDVLGEEVNNCTIGPGFIGLHNAAATNQAISGSPEGTDGATGATEDAAVEETNLEDVSLTITDNYTKYHVLAARLVALQNWVKRTREESLNVNGGNKD